MLPSESYEVGNSSLGPEAEVPNRGETEQKM